MNDGMEHTTSKCADNAKLGIVGNNNTLEGSAAVQGDRDGPEK